MRLLSVSIRLPILDISHKWNHTICGLLCLASFTEHNVLKGHYIIACFYFLWLNSIPFISFKDFILRERGREGERETMCERYIDRLPLARPQLGTWPATQACVLTGNQSGDPLVCRPALNPLSHTSQGSVPLLDISFCSSIQSINTWVVSIWGLL